MDYGYYSNTPPLLVPNTEKDKVYTRFLNLYHLRSVPKFERTPVESFLCLKRVEDSVVRRFGTEETKTVGHTTVDINFQSSLWTPLTPVAPSPIHGRWTDREQGL